MNYDHRLGKVSRKLRANPSTTITWFRRALQDLDLTKTIVPEPMYAFHAFRAQLVMEGLTKEALEEQEKDQDEVENVEGSKEMCQLCMQPLPRGVKSLESQAIFCDGCTGGYHLSCLGISALEEDVSFCCCCFSQVRNRTIIILLSEFTVLCMIQ